MSRIVAADDSRLQEGIYFRKEDRTGSCYRLLVLNINPDTSRAKAKAAIAIVWAMLEELKQGVVTELRAADGSVSVGVPHGNLKCLLGFGARLFDRYPDLSRPNELKRLGDQPSPFPSLHWSADANRDAGEGELALQFTADTELAVARAVVEVWMLIKSQRLPFEIVTFHSGFNRDDRRGWLGFHDGISNIEYDQRRRALEVVRRDPPLPPDPDWMLGGTYMGFLRLTVNLDAWRRLKREEQEILVGRDKLTGCPIESIDQAMHPVPLAGCPFANRARSAEYKNAPLPPHGQELLSASHIQRANLNRHRGPMTDDDNRIFRQGYEFVEPLRGGQLRLGLNFVSFQRNLMHLTNILRTPGWLGNANFGGPAVTQPGEPRGIDLVELMSGGYYAVPPKGDPFPGAAIF